MSESATERLRRLLDEHGVRWYEGVSFGAKAVTRFEANGVWFRYVDYDNYQWLDYDEDIPLTPERAIAATLGSERENQLELLVNQLWYLVNHRSGYGYAAALEAMEELGIEVDE